MLYLQLTKRSRGSFGHYTQVVFVERLVCAMKLEPGCLASHYSWPFFSVLLCMQNYLSSPLSKITGAVCALSLRSCRRDVKSCEFELYEAYAIDILMSTGEGKVRAV